MVVLNKMLRKILSLVSNYNFIGIFDNALTKEECHILINQFEKSPSYDGGIFYGGQFIVDHSVKKCKQLDDPFFNDKSIISNIVYTRLDLCISKYKKKYPTLGYMAPYEVTDTYSFQKYEDESDGYKSWHQEHGPGETSSRAFAWMFYLNDAKSGTEFMHFSNVHAKMGRCVIWPASWPYIHRGIVPNKGLKYIVTGWLNFHEE